MDNGLWFSTYLVGALYTAVTRSPFHTHIQTLMAEAATQEARSKKHSAVSVSSICIQQTNPPINGRPALPPEPPLRRGHDLLDHLIACFLMAAGQSEAHLCTLAVMPPGWLVAAQDDPSHPSVLLSASFLLLLWSVNGCSRYNSPPFSRGVRLLRDESGVEDGRWARPAHRGAISLRHHGHFDELPGRSLKSRRCRGDVCFESAAVDRS